ncbi:MAG: hypothetical protein ABIO81_04670 [Ginsengibacter sp.]
MAETLGMLCDKLTIVKLKQFHTDDTTRLDSLNKQAQDLQQEIDMYLLDAVNGNIPENKLTFEANKVFKKEGNDIKEVSGNIAEVFYQLADVNCRLWHEQEKVYEFESVPATEKNIVVKKLALLNLERNKCIDSINMQLAELVKQKNKGI